MKSAVAETTTAMKTPDKSKRDEWSEGGVMSLLDEYEAKWVLRNRAKLKGNDWEAIARKVTVRGGSTKSGKTASQCKNKIESLKKRYRAESSSAADNNGSASPWQFFDRMDRLVKGTHCVHSKVDADDGLGKMVDGSENDERIVNHGQDFEAQVGDIARNCDRIDVEGENHIQGSNHDDGSNMILDHSESSKPKRKMGNVGNELGNMSGFKRRKRFGSGAAESIRLLAHSMLKIEQGRIEMYKESERLRMEAEIRRAELEVRRTEIIAKTQLQIAKLFAKRISSQRDETEGSPLRAEPITIMEAEQKNG